VTPAASSTNLHEDLERQPDGVPHLVIGLTALISVVFAAVLISLLLSGPTLGSIAVAALALLAVPFIVSRLGAKAERDRDHDHPSR
jgi:predicted benzoate:H+ symporter BenE